MALALIAYDLAKGRLPPAVVYGSQDEPLYSWRVLLLPFIEEEPLYDSFRLDEPWDSPHNLALLPRMPAAYAPPGGKRWRVPRHNTVCQVFVGPGAAFDGHQGLRVARDFPDGTDRTFLVVEAGEPIPWTKPGDLAFDPSGPLPDLSCLFDDGFRAAMADGSVRFVRKEIRETTVRALVTRNGGEVLGDDWERM